MARKGLIKCIIARWGPAKKISFLLACCFMRPNGGGGSNYKIPEHAVVFNLRDQTK